MNEIYGVPANERGGYSFPDGSGIARCHWDGETYYAWWASQALLRGDNDKKSYFKSAIEAADCIAKGEEGPYHLEAYKLAHGLLPAPKPTHAREARRRVRRGMVLYACHQAGLTPRLTGNVLGMKPAEVLEELAWFRDMGDDDGAED